MRVRLFGHTYIWGRRFPKPDPNGIPITVGGPNLPHKDEGGRTGGYVPRSSWQPIQGEGTYVVAYGGGGAGGVYNGREDGIAKGLLCPDPECPLCVQGMGGAHPTDDQGRLLHYHQFAAAQGIHEISSSS